MPVQTINDFKMLFDFVYKQHSDAEAAFDFGRQQMTWNGVTAGLCTRHIRFLQSDGMSAVLDTRTNQLRFNEGSADMLQALLARNNVESVSVRSPAQQQM